MAYRQAKAAAERRYESWRQRRGLAPLTFSPAGPYTAVSGNLNQPGITDPGSTPSDSTGAIGPSNYVEFINSEIAVYSNTDLSTPTSTVDEATFTGDTSPCDGQIQWDEQGQRWLYAILGNCFGTTTGSEPLYFGWSKTATPDFSDTSTWCQYTLTTGSTIEDYPKLGHDDTQIIIGTNEFGPDTDPNLPYIDSSIWVFDKPSPGVTTCPTSTTELGNDLKIVANSGIDFTPVPANIADSSAVGYAVAETDLSHLDLYTIGRDGSGNNALLSRKLVSVPTFDFPANVPQPGTSDVIDSSDTRLTQAVAVAEPATPGEEGIWTQHTVAGPGGGPSVVRWYELTPGASTPRQTGTVSGPGRSFAFNGAISPTSDGTSAAIFYNSGSSSQLPDIRVQDRRSGTPLGTTIEDVELARSSSIDGDLSCPSQGGGSSCRWGDYAGASPDPTNTNLVWGTSMLTVDPPDGFGTPQWGTQNAAIDTSVVSPTLTVSKSGTGSGTVTSNLFGISCGSYCLDSYPSGTSITLTATPAAHSFFAGWSGACSGTATTCTVTMSQARSVTATFTLVPETLTVTKSGSGTVSSSPAGISCGSTCSHAFGYGTSVTLTATAGTGYSFAGWSGACSGTGACIVSMTQVRAVTATFTLASETLAVAKSGSGSGTVASNLAGISCGSSCSHAYTYGTSVTLTATPGTGSSFAGWSGACAGTGTCTVSMTQARAVTATFALLPETLTVTRSGKGSGAVSSIPAGINCGSTCSHAYDYGSSVALTAKPAKGSVFSGWSGACSGKSACSVTMSGTQSVGAKFAKKLVCVVPKVKGKTLKAAKRALKKHHCRPGKITRRYSKVKKGRVVSQRPRPHRHLRNGAKVKLVVSKGRKP